MLCPVAEMRQDRACKKSSDETENILTIFSAETEFESPFNCTIYIYIYIYIYTIFSAETKFESPFNCTIYIYIYIYIYLYFSLLLNQNSS